MRNDSSESRLMLSAGAAPDTAADVNDRLVAAVFNDGYTMISSTQRRGRTVLRMCLINPRTSEDDIALSIERVGDLARKLLSSTGK